MRGWLKHLAIAVATGFFLTATPLVLNLPIKAGNLLYSPMWLVDLRDSSWLPLNAGRRAITLFILNVIGWTLSYLIVLYAIRIAMQSKRLP